MQVHRQEYRRRFSSILASIPAPSSLHHRLENGGIDAATVLCICNSGKRCTRLKCGNRAALQAESGVFNGKASSTGNHNTPCRAREKGVVVVCARNQPKRSDDGSAGNVAG